MMAMTPHRASKALLGLLISISVRNKLCFVVTLLATFGAINTNAAEVLVFQKLSNGIQLLPRGFISASFPVAA